MRFSVVSVCVCGGEGAEKNVCVYEHVWLLIYMCVRIFFSLVLNFCDHGAHVQYRTENSNKKSQRKFHYGAPYNPMHGKLKRDAGFLNSGANDKKNWR